MGFIKREILIGFLVSLVAIAGGLFIYMEYISENDFSETFKMIKEGGVLGTVIALAAIPNLFVFFLFLKKNQEYRARGVLIATICVALLTFILKFV